MADKASDASLEVTSPEGSSRQVRLTEFPFFIGRGEADNHLSIPDDRISRQCATIVMDRGRYYLEDRGNRRGLFVNGQKTSRKAMADGDIITFGVENSFQILFRSTEANSEFLQRWLASDTVSEAESAAGLGKLNLLLEATKLLHSQLPLNTVLDAMLDRAITITTADRGLLLEVDADGALRKRLARRTGFQDLPQEGFAPSQTALNLALKQRAAVITEDLHQGEGALQGAQSIVVQRLRVVVAIPLYSTARASAGESVTNTEMGQLLGVLYLDSRRPAAFSTLDRQILDAIAIESASILDNARLVQREQERRRVDQELSIARQIQQALLPKGIRDFPHLSIRGINSPCYEVGGDYFDILQIDERRAAFLIADVSGKGLGAALLTTMLQGVFSVLRLGGNPSRAIAHINEFLCDRVELGRHVTLFFATLDPEGNLEYINAGHPSPLVMGRDGVKELYTEGSLPLGLMPGVDHPSAHAKLDPGETLVLFSDGVTESENSRGEFFGDDRFRELLLGQNDLPLDRLQQTILDTVGLFTGAASQADDVTLVLARYRGAAMPVLPD